MFSARRLAGMQSTRQSMRVLTLLTPFGTISSMFGTACIVCASALANAACGSSSNHMTGQLTSLTPEPEMNSSAATLTRVLRRTHLEHLSPPAWPGCPSMPDMQVCCEQGWHTSQKGFRSASTRAGSVMNSSFLTVSSSSSSADGITVASGS